MKLVITTLIIAIITTVIFLFWEIIAGETGFNITVKDVETQATPSSLRFRTPFDENKLSPTEEHAKKKEALFKDGIKW